MQPNALDASPEVAYCSVKMWIRLQEASPEAWFLLMGTLAGAVVTLMSAWLVNKSSIRHLMIQLRHERDSRHEEGMRMRHEELYVGSRKYFDAIVINYLPYREVMKGELTFDEAFDLITQQSESIEYEPHRVVMLVEMYFPELKTSLDDVLAIQDRLNRVIAGYKLQYKSGDTDGDRWLKLFQPLFDTLGERIAHFKRNVAEAKRKDSIVPEPPRTTTSSVR